MMFPPNMDKYVIEAAAWACVISGVICYVANIKRDPIVGVVAIVFVFLGAILKRNAKRQRTSVRKLLWLF